MMFEPNFSYTNKIVRNLTFNRRGSSDHSECTAHSQMGGLSAKGCLVEKRTRINGYRG
jgi:hypothetical protein